MTDKLDLEQFDPKDMQSDEHHILNAIAVGRVRDTHVVSAREIVRGRTQDISSLLSEVKALRAENERLREQNTMFAIGADKYAGLAKIVEESGELLQVIGKLFASYGLPNHWDGSNLNERIEDEISDLNAALKFAVSINPEFRGTVIARRADKKERLFNKWHKDQPALPTNTNDGEE